MTDQDPVPEYERSHSMRRAVAWGIIAFYGLTIAWASVMAVFDK